MISRINKFVLVFLIVGLALYVVLINRDSVTVHLSPGTSVSAAAGVVYIALFALGIIFTALISLIFGIRAYFRERRLHSREKQRQDFYHGMLKARGYLVSGEWGKASDQWEQIIRRDPTDIIARVELSRCLEGAGDLRGALKILEEARTADPNNTEVLFRAAELNLALKNKTAAIDNLAMILHNQPNKRAAAMARDLSEELERYGDALEYQARLEGLGASDDQSRQVRGRIEFKRTLLEINGDAAALETALRTFVKKFPECAPAYERLAELEARGGKVEDAAQHLIKAGRAARSSDFWLKAARLWLKNGQPDRAVSAARSAAREAEGQTRLRAELDLIGLFMSLNMMEEVRRSIEGFPTLASAENTEISHDLMHDYLILKGLMLSRLGEYEKSAEVWQKLCNCDFQIRDSVLERRSTGNNSAPSPVLSTP